MIAYRSADIRYPFLWEDESQPEARWHGTGGGPVQYFADTPNGAWAEYLRHEEIVEPADLAGVRRAIWAVDIGDETMAVPALPIARLVGGTDSYAACRAEALALRAAGATGLEAPSASLMPGGAAGYRVDDGLREAAPRDGVTLVLFGPRPDLSGWVAATEGRPAVPLLERVRPLT